MDTSITSGSGTVTHMALLDQLTAQIAAMQQHAADMVTNANTIIGIAGPTPNLSAAATALSAANDQLKVAAMNTGVNPNAVLATVPD